MKYISTRGRAQACSVTHAVLQGIAGDGGLYVPEEFPAMDFDWETLAECSYEQVALRVLAPFMPEFEPEELASCLRGAYGGTFEHPQVASLVRAGDVHFLELFHGRTAAFKDMALSLLPYLLTASIRKENEQKKIAIFAATSGDTGIAALKGFEDVPGTEIFVFFPEHGVSAVQKQQMRTAGGSNTHVFGIEGNFDDAQRGVKQMLNDARFNEQAGDAGYRLTAANSINIGRLLPQIVYYVWAYALLVKSGAVRAGEPMNIAVPSGNFGNILAGYYAEQIGVPIKNKICASNKNRVLADFFATGTYDARRPLYVTNAPSMDILVSSNLERLLFLASGGDGAKVAGWMDALSSEGRYEVDDAARQRLHSFSGGFAEECAIEAAIGSVFAEHGYVMDTHTSAAYNVYREYAQRTGDDTPTVITATASPYKFAESVGRALGLAEANDAFDALDALAAKSGSPVPDGLKGLRERPVRHAETVRPEDMAVTVMGLLAGLQSNSSK